MPVRTIDQSRAIGRCHHDQCFSRNTSLKFSERSARIAVAEARRLNIPIVAIVDSNADPAKVDYPIPGNDDSVRSIRVILQNLVDALVGAKKG